MTDEQHIEEILEEASAYGLRYEVEVFAERLLDEDPTLSRLDAYVMAYHDWIKQKMEAILIKLEDLIEEVEVTEKVDMRELLNKLNEIKNEVEEKIINDSFGSLEWGDLD